ASPGVPRGRPAFPTRRSSDLAARPEPEVRARRRRAEDPEGDRGDDGPVARTDPPDRGPGAGKAQPLPEVPDAPRVSELKRRSATESEEHTSELQSRSDLVCRL